MSKSYGNPQQTVLSYAAGIIDGEGCLRVMRVKPYRNDMRNPTYSPTITVGMCNRNVPELLRKHFGGSIYKERTHRKSMYRWRINSKRQVIMCLKKILPYLVVKLDEAKVLLDFCIKVKPWRGGCKPMSDNELALREEYYHKMIALKKGEVAASTECKGRVNGSDSQTSKGNLEKSE